MEYKRYVSIDRQKPTWVIVENGNVINYSPIKEELKDLKLEPPKKELYKDKEYLKEHLRKYYETNLKIPIEVDFV